MDWLEDFMGLFPLLVFIITIVIDKSSRRKRKAKRGHFPPLPDIEDNPREREEEVVIAPERKEKQKVVFGEAVKKDEEKPWYVEFPEDRKENRRVYQEPVKKEPSPALFKPPVFTVPAKSARPAFAAPAAKPKKPLFDGRLSRKRVRDGIIMAQILDKPRALKPYTDPY